MKKKKLPNNIAGISRCAYDKLESFSKPAKCILEKTHSTQDTGVVDNFDDDISSQNVIYSFLAVLVTQPSDSNEPANLEKENTIKRICKSDMNKPIQNDVSIEHYNGSKKTKMPEQLTMKHVLPLKGLEAMSISCTGARKMDTPFINNVIKTDNCPKFNGFNTQSYLQCCWTVFQSICHYATN